jgi:hypothetical protein
MQSPDCRRVAPLSGEANNPVGARPSKCLIIDLHVELLAAKSEHCPSLAGRGVAWICTSTTTALLPIIGRNRESAACSAIEVYKFRFGGWPWFKVTQGHP